MTATVDIAITQFRDEFHQKYQQMEKLAGTSVMVRNALGDAYKWPVIGNTEMVDRGSYNTSPAVNPLAKTQITTTYSEKILRTVLGKDEKTLVNADERNRWVSIHAGAVGRVRDALKLTALATATSTIAVGTTNMTLDKILEGQQTLIENSAINGDRVNFAIHANQWRALMKLEVFTSNDYFMRTLTSGKLDGFLDMNWIIFGSPTVGGLPKDGNNRSCFMWVQNALGAVNKLETAANVWWSNEKISFVADSEIIEGASVLDQDGVVEILCDETK